MTFELTLEEYQRLETLLAKRGESVNSHFLKIVKAEIRKGKRIEHAKIVIRNEYTESY